MHEETNDGYKRVQTTDVKDQLIYDSWFSGMKMDEEAMDEGVDYCGTVKTSHKGFVQLHQKI